MQHMCATHSHMIKIIIKRNRCIISHLSNEMGSAYATAADVPVKNVGEKIMFGISTWARFWVQAIGCVKHWNWQRRNAGESIRLVDFHANDGNVKSMKIKDEMGIGIYNAHHVPCSNNISFQYIRQQFQLKSEKILSSSSMLRWRCWEARKKIGNTIEENRQYSYQASDKRKWCCCCLRHHHRRRRRSKTTLINFSHREKTNSFQYPVTVPSCKISWECRAVSFSCTPLSKWVIEYWDFEILRNNDSKYPVWHLNKENNSLAEVECVSRLPWPWQEYNSSLLFTVHSIPTPIVGYIGTESHSSIISSSGRVSSALRLHFRYPTYNNVFFLPFSSPFFLFGPVRFHASVRFHSVHEIRIRCENDIIVFFVHIQVHSNLLAGFLTSSVSIHMFCWCTRWLHRIVESQAEQTVYKAFWRCCPVS